MRRFLGGFERNLGHSIIYLIFNRTIRVSCDIPRLQHFFKNPQILDNFGVFMYNKLAVSRGLVLPMSIHLWVRPSNVGWRELIRETRLRPVSIQVGAKHIRSMSLGRNPEN
jgi:hypothetical protein